MRKALAPLALAGLAMLLAAPAPATATDGPVSAFYISNQTELTLRLTVVATPLGQNMPCAITWTPADLGTPILQNVKVLNEGPNNFLCPKPTVLGYFTESAGGTSFTYDPGILE